MSSKPCVDEGKQKQKQQQKKKVKKKEKKKKSQTFSCTVISYTKQNVFSRGKCAYVNKYF